jgi:hypothetical protein
MDQEIPPVAVIEDVAKKLQETVGLADKTVAIGDMTSADYYFDSYAHFGK